MDKGSGKKTTIFYDEPSLMMNKKTVRETH